jgi:hypothetical protein
MIFNTIFAFAAAAVPLVSALEERSVTVIRPSTEFKRSSALAISENVVGVTKRSVSFNKRSAAFALDKIPQGALTGTYANVILPQQESLSFVLP